MKKALSVKRQIEVMRDWFSENYQNPVESLPYESREGGYQWIWGGPYSGRDELFANFGGEFSEKAINSLADELESITDEWSGVPDEDDFLQDEYKTIAFPSDQLFDLLDGIEKTKAELSKEDNKENQYFYRLFFVHSITLLESFLSGYFISKLNSNEKAFQTFVKENSDFKQEKFSLNEVFDHYNQIKRRVGQYLTETLWHNLPKVKKIYEITFKIKFPENLELLYKAIPIRHDLVHRNGKCKDGTDVVINAKEIDELLDEVRRVCCEISKELEISESVHVGPQNPLLDEDSAF